MLPRSPAGPSKSELRHGVSVLAGADTATAVPAAQVAQHFVLPSNFPLSIWRERKLGTAGTLGTNQDVHVRNIWRYAA
jgi:hypothetical protein